MKQICVFLSVLMLCSCEYFNVKKTSSEAILKEELQTFNWNDVDAYPSFSECDSVETKTDKKSCFENVLTLHIWEFLQREKIVVTKDVSDTIILSFRVSETGDLKLSNAKIDSVTRREIPEIEKLLYKSLEQLPPVFPATKRGQQVKTEFQLPIIIDIQ
ncbi:hypothetical protein [Algibacter lectus]|uniref:TonB C-terminal domain-containing protein n=1 Tax=Algibacter lectus TaxID=221126 RepID=A0A090W4X2_9FLAO|nr:hypothetical protein [Algibacter lectus]MWW26264.1 hypothetical protein [Algibacter lectus]TDY60259.1 hypothetical protein DFQ06_3387 [Algibacter lectus]GAL62572.1 hypothetical protein JCM19300_2625 [Algibacter lectus]SFD33999.1 hypothetical protein SAMN04489722_1088 [Algibacter lectus]